MEELASEQKSALATGPFGSAISSKFFQENGIPVIRGGNLSANTSDRMSDDGLVFVSEEKAAEFKRSVVRKGDLIFTCWGTINQVGLLDEQRQFDEYIISNKQMKVTLDVDKADPLFVYYMFSGPKKQKEILQNGIGAAVPGFNLGQLREHKLTLPNINIQRRIASYLDSLDQKITLNNQINQTLEQMAQTLFKSWFVDFDPVKAKMNGEQPKGMDAPFLSKEVASLFPEKLVESELGLIPEGWEILPSENVATVAIGKTPPRKEPQWFSEDSKDVTWISIRDMGNTGTYALDSSEYLTQEAVDKFNVNVIPHNSLILSFKLTVGRVAITHGEMATNEAIAHYKLSKDARVSTNYLYSYMKQFNFDSLGSTSSIAKAVNSKIIKALPVVVPSKEVLDSFDTLVKPLFDKIKSNQIENRSLEGLRDTLLPKLLSGEIDLENLQVEATKAIGE
ncbi:MULTISPECIES: restriction endonuclease subunit S [unclassified Vibrio]|uniref:restriction endonuclease subunit S n=1 Tax=unclassified Vibrio TaxID=2614977 RepID=UPI0035531D5F